MSRALVSEAEALSLVNKVFDQSAKLVHYSWHPYSDEQIGYLGSHWKLTVEVELNGNILEHPFFVKTLPDDPVEFECVKARGVFDQESMFLKRVVPELTKNNDVEPWSPKCYMANDRIIVLEDLGTKNYSMSPRIFDKEMVRSALETMARFHASSVLAEARHGKSLHELYPDAFGEKNFLGSGQSHNWALAARDVAVAVADSLGLESSKIPAMFASVVKTAITDQHEAKPTDKTMVACHGDLWSNNIMLSNSKPLRCMFVDYQCTRYAPPVQDLLIFLHVTTSSKFRGRFEDELIQHYYSIFQDAIERNNANVKVPSIGELRGEIANQRLRALITAALYLPNVFASGKLVASLQSNPDEFQKFQYVDRREKILEMMREDELSRSRIEDAVGELVDYGERYFNE